uniref:DUF3422 family protein n=1 Tax=Polynucleobacter sp. TaxID=2029855 RepID=UPI004048C949
MRPYDHPSRKQLHEEVHARPPIPLWPNERVLSQSFLLDATSRQQQIEWVKKLSSVLGAETNEERDHAFKALILAPEPERILVKWELHGEFATIAVVVHNKNKINGPLIESRLQIEGELDGLFDKLGCPRIVEAGGQRISALDLTFEHRSLFNDAEEVSAIFNGNTLLGSFILSSKKAQLWTDLQLDEDGYISYFIPHDVLGSRQAGRVARALAEAETYRMAAMIAFPVAKSLSLPLRNAESELAVLSEKISQLQTDSGIQTEKDGLFLGELSSLASRTEQWISGYGLRFTAAEAYSMLLNKNLLELNESPILGVQSLSEFMDRRFQPAMGTCIWTQRRLSELSDRISRTTQTLRTRIDFVNEEQTQRLLASMDQRAKLQLRLQQTVESLSVLVLTYYAVSLLAYMAKGGKEAGLPIYPEIVAGIAAPVVAILFLYISKRRRARLVKMGK